LYVTILVLIATFNTVFMSLAIPAECLPNTYTNTLFWWK